MGSVVIIMIIIMILITTVCALSSGKSCSHIVAKQWNYTLLGPKFWIYSDHNLSLLLFRQQFFDDSLITNICFLRHKAIGSGS